MEISSEVNDKNDKAFAKSTKNIINKHLSSKLKPGIDTSSLYISNSNSKSSGKSSLSISDIMKGNRNNDELMKKSLLTKGFDKKMEVEPYKETKVVIQRRKKNIASKNKGDAWFNMAAPEMTDELKDEMKVLRMRRTLDNKQFYKSNDTKYGPKFFQMGKVVESAADFYHSRIPKKQRKQTLVDELLGDFEFRQKNKKTYNEIVKSKNRFKKRKINK